MKFNSLSLVAGTRACNAACPFCVSKMSREAAGRIPVINQQRLMLAIQMFEHGRDGLCPVIITGKGEPMLAPNDIFSYLERLDFNYPLVELQTNGTLIKDGIKDVNSWKNAGLTSVCISITHANPEKSNKLMGIKGDHNFWRTVGILHNIDMPVRLNCTLLKRGCGSLEDVEKLVKRCKAAGVERLTLREVEMPVVMNGSQEAKDARDYVTAEKPYWITHQIQDRFESGVAKKLLELPSGGIVYDVDGQNVALCNCLTETTDPSNQRQLIFFPDGDIRYSWQYKGANIA